MSKNYMKDWAAELEKPVAERSYLRIAIDVWVCPLCGAHFFGAATATCKYCGFPDEIAMELRQAASATEHLALLLKNAFGKHATFHKPSTIPVETVKEVREFALKKIREHLGRDGDPSYAIPYSYEKYGVPSAEACEDFPQNRKLTELMDT